MPILDPVKKTIAQKARLYMKINLQRLRRSQRIYRNKM